MTDNVASVLIIVQEILKKNVNQSLKCFACLSLCCVDEGIVIFGKFNLYFKKIMKSFARCTICN